MYILGLSALYHDSSATLLKDGKIVVAVQEERFTRKKHDISFPVNSINYCLESQGITIKDIDYIGFYEKPLLKFERLLYQHLQYFPRSYKTFLSNIPSWMNEKLRIIKKIKKLGYKKDVLFIEHHLAHASSFLISPFKKSAILSVDGVGEWTTTAYGIGEENNIRLIKGIDFPSSLGLLYSTITAYLGFKVNNGEYKCIHPKTEILLSNGNLENIEDLFKYSGKKSQISNSEEILRLDNPIELMSLNESDLKIVPRKINIVYRKKANTCLYEVELNSGRKVIVTPNHKFTSVSFFGKVLHIEAKKLKKGNFVIIPRNLESKGKKSDFVDWMKLLAYSIAEGHECLRPEKNEAEIRIGTTSKQMIEDIENTARKIGKKFRLWGCKRGDGMKYIGISVWENLKLLREMGYDFGKRAGTKSVPISLMTSNKEIKKVFLSTLFDCGGGFTGHQIIYTSISKTLINQISYLLLNFGIHFKIRRRLNKKFSTYYYRIEIEGKYLKKFEKEIGFNLKEKRKKLRNYLSNSKRFGKNAEFIPINDYLLNKWISSNYKKIDLYKKIGCHFWDYETKRKYATPRFLDSINKILNDSKIKKFIESDVFFDKVKSIRKVNFKGYVYDVSVPKNHNFIGGFGGIVLHNTMGLASYGDKNKETNIYYGKLKEVIDIKEGGSYKLDIKFFDYCHKDRMPSRELCSLLDGEIRKPESEITKRHKDIASALQMIYEEVLFKMLNYVHKETKCENLVLTGGCGLNSVANGKILKNTNFKNIWIQPDSGDGGTSMGVAVYINSILGNQRSRLETVYLGPKFSREEIKSFLDENKITYSEIEDLPKTIAKLIYEDNIIGWFQGRMEWGQRALGNRSILSNPTNKDMQNILNLKVKHRLKFRPFAPSVCEDDANTYFECDIPIPEPTDYMLMVYPVKEEWREKIPAVTHVDGSGRLQTIKREQNPIYYDLIKEFGKLSGIPILINTSFNVRGEPIVCTPQDAYNCFKGTEIDYLVMGSFLIKKNGISNGKEVV